MQVETKYSPTRLDVKVDLFAGDAQTFDRPSSWAPAEALPDLALGYIGLKKITAVNQISVDRTACVVQAGQANCKIVVNWTSDPQGAVWPDFHVLRETQVGLLEDRQVSFLKSEFDSRQGTWVVDDFLTVGERVRYIMVSDFWMDNSYDLWEASILYQTPEIRAVAPDIAPTVSFNEPLAWNRATGTGTIYHANQPIELFASAASSDPITGFEFAVGETVGAVARSCALGSPFCIPPIPSNLTPEQASWTWPGGPAGDYTIWVRAKTDNPDRAAGDWQARTIKLATPPAVQINSGAHSEFGRLEPVPLQAIVSSGNQSITTVQFYAERQFGPNRNPFSIGSVGNQANGRYNLSWTDREPGEYQVFARVIAGALEPFDTNRITITIESDAPTIAFDVNGCNADPCAVKQGPPVHTVNARIENPHWFKKISLKAVRSGQTTTLDFCTTNCLVMQSLEWNPALGTHALSVEGTLIDNTVVVTGPRSVTVAERDLRKSSLVLREAPVDPAVPGLLNGDSGEPLGLYRDITHRAEAACSHVILQGAVPPRGSHSEEAYCELLRSAAFSVGRCRMPLCDERTPVDLHAAEICPEGGCAGSHPIVSATLFKHDGLLVSEPVDIIVPGAVFEGSQNIPEQIVKGGGSHVIQLTFRNSGMNPWSPAKYRLRNTGDSWGAGFDAIALPSSVAAQSSVSIPVVLELDADSGFSGERVFRWQIEGPVGRFGDMSAEAVIRVVEPENPDPVAEARLEHPALDPAVEVPEHDETLGALSGTPGVSGGAATYQIAIAVPPGRRAMQPSVALAYSSRAGNGTAGMGWSLQAGSAIHRCPSTIAQDGILRAVRFDASDKLCLDGERLVLDPSSPPSVEYGQEGALYRTEIDSGTRVTQLDGALDAVGVRFVARSRDGILSTYGRRNANKPNVASEAMVMPQPVVPGSSALALSWLVSHREDIAGNGMDYLYIAEGSGETLLSEINYTHRMDAPEVASRLRQVKFGYETRADRSTSYLAGYKSEQTKRLQYIKTYVGTTLVRSYDLEYRTSAATGRSLLRYIKECANGSGGLVCRDGERRTAMDWHQHEPRYQLEADANLNPPGSELHQYLGSFATSVRLYAAADYDGNGSRDILWHGPVDDTTNATRLLTLSPDRTLTGVIDVTGIFPTNGAAIDPKNRVDFRGRADFDLDGRPELFGLRNGKLSIHFWREDDIDAAAVTPFDDVYSERWDTDIQIERMQDIRYVGDVTGDGKPEIVYVHGNSCGTPGSEARRVIVRSMNPGSGKPSDEGAVKVKTFTSTILGWIPLDQTCTNVGGGAPLMQGEDLEHVADFDGDGLLDFWVRDERYSDVHALDGSDRQIALGSYVSGSYAIAALRAMPQLTVDGVTNSFERHPNVPVFWLDINGDGLDDWLYPVPVVINGQQRGRWQLRLNLGGAWGEAQTPDGDNGVGIERCGAAANGQTTCASAWVPWRLDRIRPMDYNTDGRSELLVPTSYAARMCTFSYESDSPNTNCQISGSSQPASNAACAAPYPSDMLVEDEQPSGFGCRWVAYCPERMQSGAFGNFEALGKAGMVATRDSCGRVDLNNPQGFADLFRPLYSSGSGMLDHSSYNLAALKFRETASGFEVIAQETTLIAGQSSLEAGEDIYGDGLADLITKVSCYSGYGNGGEGRRPCGIPVSYGTSETSYVKEGDFFEIPSPGAELLFGTDIPFATPSVLVNRNVGAAEIPGSIPDAPDMMWMVSDGLGRHAWWDYSPLGASAGRLPTDIPLYRLTGGLKEPSQIHFTSSMHVVATMGTSDGVDLGTERTYRYGYEDALYDVDGRGFLGFGKITEVDDVADRTTHTWFHQSFPLTGRLSKVETAVRGGVDLVSDETVTWHCRSLALGNGDCGTAPPPYQVNQARKITRTYHLPALLSESLPHQVSESWQISAVPLASVDACSENAFPIEIVPAVSDFGNVLDQTTITWDISPGMDADAKRTKTCERIQSDWHEDASAWWIDALEASITTRKVFEFKSGAWAETDQNIQTLEMEYDSAVVERLPSAMIHQPESDSQVVTEYEYTPAGQPESITVRFDDLQFDHNGNELAAVSTARTSLTGYLDEKGDDYFPVSVTNALGHEQKMATRWVDGQPESTTDANGVKTIHSYDSFGSLIGSTVLPRSGAVLAHPIAISLLAPDDTCPDGSVVRRVQVQRGVPTQTTCLDLFGRTLRVSSPILGGQMVRQDTVYDARGLVTEQTQPYRVSDGVGGKTLFAYDVLERPVTKRVSQANGKILKTTYSYDRRTTTITAQPDVAQALCDNLPGLSSSPAAPAAPALCSVGSITLKREQDSQGRFVGTRDAATGVTRFRYDALGNIASITGVDGVTTTATYDDLGFRTSITDPNQGYWEFRHNAVGELRWQKDQRQATAGVGATVWQYDAIGRVVNRRSGRADVDGSGALQDTVDAFKWDADNATGQLETQSRKYVTPGTVDSLAYQERLESNTYDVFGRRTLLQVAQSQGPGSTIHLSTEWGFDPANGRLWWQKWNDDEGLWFVYDGQGRHIETRDGRDADNVYWKGLAQDAWGRVSRAQLGGVVERNAAAVPATGQIASITYTAHNAGLQSFGYAYDVFGNVVQQQLDAFGTQNPVAQEDFVYDTLHRLVRAQRTGHDVVDYRYAPNGNIVRKGDYGTGNYGYVAGTRGPFTGWAGPNAVRSVPFGSGTRTLSYDPNGNLVTASAVTAGGVNLPAFSAAYDANNQPVRTALGGTTLRFGYGPDGQRARQSGASAAENRVYMPGYEYTSEKSRYYVGDYALITRTASGRRQEYLATDRLGSVAGVLRVGYSGGVSLVETRGFDPYGKPRDGNWDDAPGDALPHQPATPRGFTAHEHLDEVKLIHMNGRAFDYGLGRFLSVDPFVQFPLNSQSLNPYSYILNNPLSGTDPTGYKSENEKEKTDTCAASRLKGVCSNLPPNMGGSGPRTQGGGNNGAGGGGEVRIVLFSASEAGSPGDRDRDSDKTPIEWFSQVDRLGNPDAGNPLGGVAITSSVAVVVVVTGGYASFVYIVGNPASANAVGAAIADFVAADAVGGATLSTLPAAVIVASAKAGSGSASSAMNAARLNYQLIGEEVANGHAFAKHVVERGEFADLGISTREQLGLNLQAQHLMRISPSLRPGLPPAFSSRVFSGGGR